MRIVSNAPVDVPQGVAGVASSATKLQTARLINGVLFDGTANIEIGPIRPDARTFVLENPTDDENITVFATAVAVTLISMKVVLHGDTPSVTFQLHYGVDRSVALANVFSTSQTVTNTTTLVELVITNGSIPTNGILWLTTSAASGTIDDITLAFEIQ